MSQIILGIDPGSRKTGYGVIECGINNKLSYLGSGCINVGTGPLCERLHGIFVAVNTIIMQFKPTILSIEETFLSKNVQSTIKLSEARASAIVAAMQNNLEVYEYTPRQIKQAVVGFGAAKKNQIQFMVQHILYLTGTPQADAADALACAICHANSNSVLKQIK